MDKSISTLLSRESSIEAKKLAAYDVSNSINSNFFYLNLVISTQEKVRQRQLVEMLYPLLGNPDHGKWTSDIEILPYLAKIIRVIYETSKGDSFHILHGNSIITKLFYRKIF
jgi:hypothetical protein